MLEYKTLGFSLKADGAGEFEGLGAAFHNIDASCYGDIIAPGAFAQDLPQFLAEGFIGGINHDWNEPIGKPLVCEERADGLFLRGSISDTAAGRDVRTLMKDGVIKRLSIGFRALGRKWLETADEVMAYWQGQGYTPGAEDVARSAYGARLLTRIRLYEVSPVAVPANRRAVITGVKEGVQAFRRSGVQDESGEGSPVVGATLAAHSDAVLATVEEWAERLRSLAELRAADGRGLSPGHVASATRLRELLGEVTARAAASKGGEAGAGSRAGGRRLFAEFQRLQAALNGAAVE